MLTDCVADMGPTAPSDCSSLLRLIMWPRITYSCLAWMLAYGVLDCLRGVHGLSARTPHAVAGYTLVSVPTSPHAPLNTLALARRHAQAYLRQSKAAPDARLVKQQCWWHSGGRLSECQSLPAVVANRPQ